MTLTSGAAGDLKPGSFLVLMLWTHRQTELVPGFGQLLNVVLRIGQETPQEEKMGTVAL